MPGRTSYKLGSLVAEFNLAHGLDDSDRPHRATYDALVAARLFVHLADRRSIDELRHQPPGRDRDDEPTLF